MTHDLPGTDSRFHESRNYLSVMTYRGEEILASHGSCKEAGCGYRAAWKSNAARDKAMWEHRALKVREARAHYFYNLFDGDQRKVGEMFQNTADRNSHRFDDWFAQVKHFELTEITREVGELVKYDYRVAYDLGRTAREAFEELLQHSKVS